MDWILASASPRRLELLRQIGVNPHVLPADVDETPRPDESPEAFVTRLAQAKGHAVRDRLDPGPAILLAADTCVATDGAILNKPEDADEAKAMLDALSGRTHRVWTGVWLGRGDDARESLAAVSTVVTFRALTPAWIDAYVASGEPLGKAGAYAIQGLGAVLVESARGSWSNVVGLPLEHIPTALAAVGLDVDSTLPWMIASAE